jgi:hypothetical protein
MESLNVTAAPPALKEGDVELIVSFLRSLIVSKSKADDQVRQVGCTKEEAQEALRANKGDLVGTLIKLVQPRSRAKSVDGGAEKA